MIMNGMLSVCLIDFCLFVVIKPFIFLLCTKIKEKEKNKVPFTSYIYIYMRLNLASFSKFGQRMLLKIKEVFFFF